MLIADEKVDEGLNNAPKLSSFFTLSRSSTEVQTLSVKLNLIWCFLKKGFMLKRNLLNMLSQSHKYNGAQLKINCFTNLIY